jgi:hypothetical protein
LKFDEFFDEARRRDVKIDLVEGGAQDSMLLSNEALFHLPLLAMIILVLAKGHKKPRASELGQLVGDCIERTLAGFKGSAQHVGWSANLRIRTIRALSFLEVAGLVTVEPDSSSITVTTLGRRVIVVATKEDGNLSSTLASIERNYGFISREQQLRLELR